MASVGEVEDIAREILLRLPAARDLARCACVCRLWRDVVRDPSFRTLHHDISISVTAGGTEAAEALIVTELRLRGEMAILNVASGKPMCRFTELAPGYAAVNACNGFLLLASGVLDWPLYVCNPVLGEKLQIPAPPRVNEDVEGRAYAIGFCSSIRHYKLFCLSFTRTGFPERDECYLDVYILGDSQGRWRRHENLFPGIYSSHPPPPEFLNGKLYAVIERPGNCRAPDRMLVIDVLSEAHFTYCLPVDCSGSVLAAAVQAFELSGKLCVAVRINSRRRINFWVLQSLNSRRPAQLADACLGTALHLLLGR